MDSEKERKEFEQHLTDTGLVEFAGYGFAVDECDEYLHEPTQVAWDSWLIGLNRAKAQAVPEGFVEKTESNTHHYFKLKDWDEWGCIYGIEDAITSDYDINAIVEVDCLEVIEISNKPCFALLASGKSHGTEVKFFDTKEEATEAQEQKG